MAVSGFDPEKLLRNLTRLNLLAWVVLVLFPLAIFLVTWHFLGSAQGRPLSGRAGFPYLPLVVALVIPAIGLLIVGREVRLYRAGKSVSKTPWHLFLSVSVFQMFMITIVYVAGVVWSFYTRALSHIVYFYGIALVWALVCWPRSHSYEMLKARISKSAIPGADNV